MLEAVFANQVPREQFFPMDIHAPFRNVQDWLVRIAILQEQDIRQINRESDRVKIEGSNGDGVAVECLVGLSLEVTAERRVDKQGADEDEQYNSDASERY